MNHLFAYQSIKRHCPNMLQFPLESENKWERINKKVISRIRTLEALDESTEPRTIELTLFDHTLFADRTGNAFSISFLSYLNYVFGCLASNFPREYHSRWISTIYDLMQNFDLNGSRYLDRLGEILLLHKFTKTPNVKIDGFEIARKEGTRIDLILHETRTGIRRHIEFSNLRPNTNKLSSVSDVKKFFAGRLDRKIESKKIGANDKDIIFALILWCNPRSLAPLREFFRAYNNYDGHDVLFVNLDYVENADNSYFFRFGATDRVIELLLKGR